jgi:hypothetical protein
MTVYSAPGQSPIPKRKIDGGGGASPGVSVIPSKPQTVTKKVTYMALSKKRQWISRDGNFIFGTLLAFDAGDETTFIPPTVIKADKVRLLKEGKEFVIPLERLQPAHQDDVLEIETKIKASYAAMKKAKEAAAASKPQD